VVSSCLPALAARAQDCPLAVPIESSLQQADVPQKGATDEAPARVVKIRFIGNSAVGAGRLRRAMTLRTPRLGRPAEASRYVPSRWEGEHRRLCDVLRGEGFVTARVGPPEVTDAPGARAPGAPRSVVLTIPIAEGPRYRLGTFALDGVSALDEAEARARFVVEPGEPYAHDAVQEGLAALRRAYAGRGHAQWTATTVLRPHAERGVVDVTVRVE
jgi:outer membrane protein assembly factor BamA